MSRWRESVPCGVEDGQEIWRQCSRDTVGLPLEDDEVGRKENSEKKEEARHRDECEANLLEIRDEFHDPEWLGDVLETRFQEQVGDSEHA